MKYRKKPVVIDAMQITEDACWAYWERGQLFFDRFGFSGDYHPGDRKIYKAYTSIETLEGTMRAELGDWIIKGVKGEFYPCKPDIFAATYEPANEPPTRTWTSALPSKVGFYWVRSKYTRPPIVVAVREYNFALKGQFYAKFDDYALNIKDICEAEWAGPLDSPAQPTAAKDYRAARGCAPSVNGLLPEEAINGEQPPTQGGE